jgi:VCBS repeat-containing protein
MKTLRTVFPALLLTLAIVSDLTAQTPAGQTRAVVPVVGSTGGSFGANFRTELQIHNPGSATITGRLVFRAAGRPGGPDDPFLAYTLEPFETKYHEDVVVQMGATGLGSLDVIPDTDSALPTALFRAYDDKAAGGTTGVTVPMVPVSQALSAGRSAALVVPASLVRFRFNVGIRSLDEGVTIRVVLYEPDGTVAAALGERSYPENYFEQRPAREFLGMEPEPDQSIGVTVIEGRAILYGTTTDNRTNDGSIQLDEIFNTAPTVTGPDGDDSLLIIAQTTTGEPVMVSATVRDEDGDTIHYAIGTAAAHGSVGEVVVTSNGFTVIYTPAPGFSGEDEFKITISDGEETVILTVRIIVNRPGNTVPTAEDIAVTTMQETPVEVTLRGSDADGDLLLFSIVTAPSHGTLSSVARIDRTRARVTYTPMATFRGLDGFEYRVDDGRGGTARARVIVTVTPAMNRQPTANDQSVTTTRDVAVAITLSGSDADGDPLTYSVTSTPASGTLSGTAPNLTYTPIPGFSGIDGFTFIVNDGTTDSAPATVTITVLASNQAPTALDLTGDTVAENEPVGTVIGTFSTTDPDPGDTHVYSFAEGTGSTHNALFRITGDQLETATVLDFEVQASLSIRVRTTDAGGLFTEETFTITVIDVDDPPVAADDTYSVARGGTLSVPAATGVLANDSDVDSATLTAQIQTTPVHGVLTLNADGSFTYVHDGSLEPSDSFTYRAHDGNSSSNLATVTIAITAVNTPPVASDDAYNVVSGGTLTVAAGLGVLANDSDAEGAALTAVLVGGVTNGILTFEADGAFVYQHDDGAAASDSFTYRAHDGQDESNIATVTITITAGNTPPVAVADDYSVTRGATLTITAPGVLGNDSDADGDALTAQLVSGTTNGLLALEADGAFVYVHDGGTTVIDSFSYRAHDGQAESNVVVVSIEIRDGNVAPVATDDGYSTNEDETLVVAVPGVLANDSDADGDALTAVLVSTTGNGTLSLEADGSFVYIPSPDFFGTDSFTYRAHDGAEDSNVATVTIIVDPVNDPPSFTGGDDLEVDSTDGGLRTFAGWASDLSAGPANESDQTLTFVVTGNSAPALFTAGPAIAGSSGDLTFTPVADAQGLATITIVLQDDGGTANGGGDTSAAYAFTIQLDAAPRVISTIPADGASAAPSSAVTIRFNESVEATPSSFELHCPASVPVAFALSASPAVEFTLTPAAMLLPGAECQVRVIASAISDTDTFDPPDRMVADHIFSFTVAEGGAATSTIVANPVSITADGTSTSTITVQLKDGDGNDLTTSGGVVTLSATDGTLSAVTDHDDGTYSATLTSSTSTGTVTVSATLNGALLANTATVSFIAGDPARYIVTAASATLAAGDTVTITAQRTDANGHPVATENLTVTWTSTDGGSFASPTSLTDASGVATIDFTTSTTAGTTHTVTATDGEGITGTSGGITTLAGPATRYLVTSSDNAPPAGDAVTITAQLTDANDNPVATENLTVTWTSTNGGSFASPTSLTDASGVATIDFTTSTTAGTTHTVTATDGGGLAGTSGSFSTVAGALAAFVVEAAGGGSITTKAINESFGIRITAVDANGNTVTTFDGAGNTVEISSTSAVFTTGDGTTAAFSAGVIDSHTVAMSNGGTHSITATRTGGSESGTSNSFEIHVSARVISTVPADSTVDVSPDTTIAVNFSETVTVSTSSFEIRCPSTGSGRSFTLNTTSGSSIVLTPAADLPGGTSCQVTVFAVEVENGAGFNMTADQVFSFTTTPVAKNDAYPETLTGNVGIDSSRISYSVLDNDEFEGTATILSYDSTTAHGGSVTMTTGGSEVGQFTYTPAAGFQGTDTFTYTMSVAGSTATATVTIQVSGMIWFVDSSALATGDGTLDSPFNCLTGPGCFSVATHQDGDNIFLYAGSHTGGLTLKNGQKLIGQGASSGTTLAAIAGLTVPSSSDPLPLLGGDPTSVLVTAATGVTLGQGNTLRGMKIVTSAGEAIAGSVFGTLTTAELHIEATGAALALENGTLSGTVDLLSSSGSPGRGLILVDVDGALEAWNGAISDAAGVAVYVAGGSVDLSYAGAITNSVEHSVYVTGRLGGTLTLSGNIDDTGSGILVTGNSGGTISFNGAEKTIATGANHAVVLIGNPGATIGFGGGGLSIVTTTGDGFIAAAGGTITVTGGFNEVSSGSGIAVGVMGTSIGATGMTFLRVSSGGGNGIVLHGTGANTFTITGDGTPGSGGIITTAAGGAGVSLTDTSSTTLNHLVIAGAGAGIAGNTFGWLKVDGTTVSSTGAPALHLMNGSVDGTFPSVSASGSSTHGVSLTGVGGTWMVSGGTVTGSANGSALHLAGNQAGGTIHWQGALGQAEAQPAVSVSGHASGTLHFTGALASSGTSTGLVFSGANGTYALSPSSVTTLSGTGGAITIAGGSNGSFSFSSNLNATHPGGSSTLFQLSSSAPTVSFSGNLTQTLGATGRLVSISLQGPGSSVTFLNGTLLAAAGEGIVLTGASGGVNFAGTTTISGSARVRVLNGSTGTISFGSGASITNPTTEPGLFIMNGTTPASITFSGPISSNAHRPVHVEGVSGGSVIVSGNLTATGQGMLVQNNSGGTIAFTGVTKSFNTGTNAAVTLTSNTGAVISFSGTTLQVTTTSGNGIAATGGGTLEITGNSNTISSTGGIALRLENTASGGLRFVSISAKGGSHGIVMINTGTTSGLLVTGTGGTCTSVVGACNGGTIEGTISDGVRLTNARDISLNEMKFINANGTDGGGAGVCDNATNAGCRAVVNASNVTNLSLSRVFMQGSAEQGINGRTVHGFSLTDSRVENMGNDVGEHALYFEELQGTVSITGSTIIDGRNDLMRITNRASAGALNRLTMTITNSTFEFGSTRSSTFPDVANNAISVRTDAPSGVALTIQNTTFRNTVASALNFGGGAVAGSSGSDTITLAGNTVTNTVPGKAGNFVILGQENRNTTFAVNDNVFRGASGIGVIVVQGDDSAIVTGTINGNDIDSSTADGLNIAVDENARMSLTIDGNTIANTESDLIEMVNFADGSALTTAKLIAEITNNNLSATTTDFIGGVGVFQFEANDPVCVRLTDNTINMPAASGGFAVYLESFAGTAGKMRFFAPTAADITAADVRAVNTIPAPDPVAVFSVAGTNGSSCSAVVPIP